METIVIALIALLGGGGGAVAFYKAWSDHKNQTSSREEDAEDRLVSRLEARLTSYETRITKLETQHDEDNQYILKLTNAMARAGIDVPPRKKDNP